MGYIKDHVTNNLRHTNGASFLDEDVLRKTIWYSATKEAYAQRTEIFDNSWLKSEASSNLIALLMKQAFALNTLYIYHRADVCHAAIDVLSPCMSTESCGFVYKKGSLFQNIMDYMRNGLAHGTFNELNDKSLIVCQHKASQESPIKFLIQTHACITRSIQSLHGSFEEMLVNPAPSLKRCLANELGLPIRDDELFLQDGTRISVDLDFRFQAVTKDNGRVIQLRKLMEHYRNEEQAVLIILEPLRSISSRNRKLDDESVRVITVNEILDFFDFKSIVTVE